MKYLTRTLTEMNGLDLLQIVYTNKYYRHCDNHNQMLGELEKFALKVTGINHIKISTICGFAEKGYQGCCSNRDVKLQRAKEKNAYLKKLSFMCPTYHLLPTPFNNVPLISL